MNRKSVAKILAAVTSFISACCILLFFALSIFNGCLLKNLTNALPIVELYGKDKIPPHELSSHGNEELMFFNGDPGGCRQYLEETKAFLLYLVAMLTFFTFIFCASVYAYEKIRSLQCNGRSK